MTELHDLPRFIKTSVENRVTEATSSLLTRVQLQKACGGVKGTETLNYMLFCYDIGCVTNELRAGFEPRKTGPARTGSPRDRNLFEVLRAGLTPTAAARPRCLAPKAWRLGAGARRPLR